MGSKRRIKFIDAISYVLILQYSQTRGDEVGWDTITEIWRTRKKLLKFIFLNYV